MLERAHRIHVSDPRTPHNIPASEASVVAQMNGKEEPELEIDLESLGLEDREIPAEHLTKLEKIGSGGFKE